MHALKNVKIKFMDKEVNPLFAAYLLREIFSDISFYFNVRLKEN